MKSRAIICPKFFKSNVKAIAIPIVIAFIALLYPVRLYSQVPINVDLSASILKANEGVELTFSLSEPADFKFFSTEVLFDTEIFEFRDAETVGLTEDDGLLVADIIEPGRLGVSVTLTEDLETDSDDAFMTLRFDVISKASVGTGDFSFENEKLSDSADEGIESEPIPDSSYEIEKSIGIAELTTDGVITVAEGDEFHATGRIYAADITDDSANENRIHARIGVSSSNTEPNTWNEGDWHEAEFVEKDGEDYFVYSSEVAFMRPAGDWYLAIRADLDQNEDHRYGGNDGLWDNDSAIMTIEQRPPFRYTLATWDFDDETRNVSQAVPANEGTELEIFGASIASTEFISGASGRAANSSGWTNYDDEDGNYWQVLISTEGFEELRLSSKQSGSGSGPRDFELEVSIDGEDWEAVNGGVVDVSEDWSSGVVDGVLLPEIAIDREQLFIRWIQTSDISVDGNDGVDSRGTNRIDDIKITGINMNTETVEVWPGDTNDDGVVDEEDLQAIGTYWLAEGPKPVYESRVWNARETEAWIPKEATFADASGSGRVDHNDLRPIGLNFGESNGQGKEVKEPMTPIAELTLDEAEEGELIELYLVSELDIDLTGLSFRVELSGIERSSWSYVDVTPGDWGDLWQENDRLLEFDITRDDYFAASFVHKGKTDAETADRKLAVITLRADRYWNGPVTANLLRSTINNNGDVSPAENVQLVDNLDSTPEPPDSQTPDKTELLDNYPNPFHRSTAIPYNLSETGTAKVIVYDMLGRRVSTYRFENQQPGSYSIDFDATDLSSGAYIYQLLVDDLLESRLMMLVR